MRSLSASQTRFFRVYSGKKVSAIIAEQKYYKYFSNDGNITKTKRKGATKDSDNCWYLTINLDEYLALVIDEYLAI